MANSFSGKKKAHKLLTHNLFEKVVNSGATSRLTRRNCLFSWVQRRTHELLCPVNWPAVPVPTGTPPEQKVCVYVPFSPPIFVGKRRPSNSGMAGVVDEFGCSVSFSVPEQQQCMSEIEVVSVYSQSNQKSPPKWSFGSRPSSPSQDCSRILLSDKVSATPLKISTKQK